jgi:GT2 family glycosyltransferase
MIMELSKMPSAPTEALEARPFKFVSIVISTYDRPAALETCLQLVVAQQTSVPLEIIVVDNHPSSGITPPIVAKFPNVRLVKEARGGSSYGRNAGIVASRGEIVAMLDDDVLVPPTWIEELIAAFTRDEIGVVTGNVLPYELETEAQRLYQTYNPLGRGPERQEFDTAWLASFRKRSAPSHLVGVGANCAVRAEVFADPKAGLQEERLGPGTPAGSADDNYFFYRVMRAGYTIAYEPNAYVWHQHRRSMDELRRQVVDYGRSMIAYELQIFLRDHDWRGLWQLLAVLPIYRVRQLIGLLVEKARGKQPETWDMFWWGIEGNLKGLVGYWQTVQRVKQLGRSQAYVMPEARGQAVRDKE